MKSKNVLFLIFVGCFGLLSRGYSTPWTDTSGDVPAAGSPHIITTTITMTGNLTVKTGAILEIQSPGKLINDASVYTIEVENGGILKVNGGQLDLVDGRLDIHGKLINLSTTTINSNGDIYLYGNLENGDVDNAGEITLNYPSHCFILSGSLANAHADSSIDIKQGGNLYNYFGAVDARVGELNLLTGGKFHNARGIFVHNPFTASAGSNFSDSPVATLDEDLVVSGTWKITGKGVINGNGNKITFEGEGAILVDGPESSLMLADVILDKVSANRIRCTDDTSTLTIHNVVWNQDANFTFTKGRFFVASDWTILGADTQFIYESSQTSTIYKNSTLHCVLNTFNYNVSTNANRLRMEDDTAHIHLERATFFASHACNLKLGTLLISGMGTLQTPVGGGLLNATLLDDINIAGDLRRIGNVGVV